MKKTFLVLIICLFIFLPACANNVVPSNDGEICFSIEINQNGSIRQSISFPTQASLLDLSQEQEQNYLKELTLAIKSKLFFPYFVNFYATSTLKGNQEYVIGGEKLSYNLPAVQDDVIVFDFIFADSETWEYYHDTQDDDGLDIERGIFINLGKSKNQFLFSQKANFGGKEQTLGEYFYSLLSSVQEKYVSGQKLQNIQKPKFSYIYSHPSNKVHSNADERFESEGQIVNVWSQEIERLGEEKMVEIFVYSPNKAVWYACAVGGTIVAMIIVWVFNILRRKKKRAVLTNSKGV